MRTGERSDATRDYPRYIPYGTVMLRIVVIRHGPPCSSGMLLAVIPAVHPSVSYAPFLVVYPPVSVLTMANILVFFTRARARAKEQP